MINAFCADSCKMTKAPMAIHLCLCVRFYSHKHQTHTHTPWLCKNSLVLLSACVFVWCILMVTICLHYIFNQEKGWKWLCGRNYSQFWQGLLSAPICESGLRLLAKHNISSILSQWQANIIEQRRFFQMLHSTAVSIESTLPDWVIETDGGKVGKNKGSEKAWQEKLTAK